MKYLSLLALCVLQPGLVSAAQAWSQEKADHFENSPQWSCLVAIAASEQDQGESNQNEQQSEEEPDCE